MKLRPMSNVQRPKSRRRFAGVSIITWLAGRASSTLRVLSSALEQRISNSEPRALNEEASTYSVPANSTNTATENNALLAPRLSGGRNEVRGGSHGEPASTEIAGASQFDGPSTPPPSFPFHGGTRDGFAASANFPTGSTITNSSRASAHENSPIDSQSIPANNATNAPASAALTQGDQHSASHPGFITRQELKRELESLRRLMESRK